MVQEINVDYLKTVEQFMTIAGQDMPTEFNGECTEENVLNYVAKCSYILSELRELIEAGGYDIVKYMVAYMRLELAKLEQYTTLFNAYDSPNKVKCADALADLQYVLSGAIIGLGFKDNFNNIFNQVHINNMTKFIDMDKDNSDIVIEETTRQLKARNIEIELQYMTNGDNTYAVIKTADSENNVKNGIEPHKVCKPCNYKSVKLIF